MYSIVYLNFTIVILKLCHTYRCQSDDVCYIYKCLVGLMLYIQMSEWWISFSLQSLSDVEDECSHDASTELCVRELRIRKDAFFSLVVKRRALGRVLVGVMRPPQSRVDGFDNQELFVIKLLEIFE